MFHVDESRSAAACLALCDDVLAEGGLTGGLRTVNLSNASFWDAPNAQRDIQRKRAGGNDFHLHLMSLAEAHDAALAIFFDDIV